MLRLNRKTAGKTMGICVLLILSIALVPLVSAFTCPSNEGFKYDLIKGTIYYLKYPDTILSQNEINDLLRFNATGSTTQCEVKFDTGSGTWINDSLFKIETEVPDSVMTTCFDGTVLGFPSLQNPELTCTPKGLGGQDLSQ